MSLYQRFKARFGTAGVVIGVIALVMAMVTGAYAAGGGLSGKQKKEVKKIAKQFAGQPGAQGPAGPQGPTGPKGEPGARGSDGTNGVNGKSVVTGNEATGTSHCEERGGAWVEVEGSGVKRYVCNGASGAAAGGTQTGLWGFVDKGQGSTFVTISFPQQLSTIPTVEWMGPSAAPGSNPHCPGLYTEPKAEPGFLCLYALQVSGAGEGLEGTPRDTFTYTADPKSGLTMEFGIPDESTEAYGAGSWAVTE